MEINYKTDDESIDIKLLYIVKQKLTRYRKDKYWPKHTQCLLFYNGLLLGFGEVIKHEKDSDNQSLAYKLATKKVMDKIFLPYIRRELWKKLIAEIKSQTTELNPAI